MLGNQFNAYILPGQIDTIWEETQKNNEAARAEELITFFFNREPVETQLAQISSIVQEYEPILVSGLDDPDKVVAGMREKLKAAGIDDVIAEMQKQIDAWRTSK
jgi:putative aldouronate transport system substrate-binding protein